MAEAAGQKKTKRNSSLLLFGIACLYCLIGFCYIPFESFYDEGVILVGAERVLRGEVPYKDFWVGYPPGSFWLVSSAFRCFGTTLFVARMVGVVCWGLLIGMTYLVATNMMSSRMAIFVSCLTLIWMKKGTGYNYPPVPALFWMYGGCLSLNHYLHTKKRIFLFFTGSCGGGAILFRHDFGIAFLLVLSLWNFLHHRLSLKKSFQDLFFLYGGALCVLLFPLMVLFLRGVAPKTLIQDLVVFPMKVYPEASALPIERMDPQDILPFSLTLFCLGSGIAAFLWRALRKNVWRNEDHLSAILLGLGILLFFPAKIRMDFAHLFGSFSPSILVGGYLFEQRIRDFENSPFSLRRGVLITVSILFAFLFGIFPMLQLVLPWTQDPIALGLFPHELPRARGFYSDPYFLHREKTIHYLQQQVMPDEKIYVGLTHHDRLIGNDVFFYFLCKRWPATRYHQLHPGIATQEKIQQEIIQDLEKNRTRYIVLWHLYPAPLLALQKEGSFRLDVFIRTHYQRIMTFGPYSVLKLKEA